MLVSKFFAGLCIFLALTIFMFLVLSQEIQRELETFGGYVLIKNEMVHWKIIKTSTFLIVLQSDYQIKRICTLCLLFPKKYKYIPM